MVRQLLYLIVIALKLSSILSSDLDWWKTAVIYQIYVRSFKDSDGDGYGDLQGILDKMDYIKDLKVDAVWLTPVYPTADEDFGYDIIDMITIYDLLGNFTTFDKIVAELHQSGMKIIMDFVPNHTSNKHEWFIKSARRDDKYEDYYVWLPGILEPNTNITNPPNNWFCGTTDGSAWTWNDIRKQYYLHQFMPEQPDLNLENDIVVQELMDVLDFWLRKGVDGFRIDAVYTLCENQDFEDEILGPNGERYHEKTFDQPKSIEVLAKFRSKLDEFTAYDNKTRIMIVEYYNANLSKIKKYYGTKNVSVAHYPFNFCLTMNLSISNDGNDWARCINQWYSYMGEENVANWLSGNHDQPRVGSRYLPEYIDIVNILILSLKGTTITYYGEEIGMLNSIVRMDQAKDPQGKNFPYQAFLERSRDPWRGPFLWDTNVTAGFSTSVNSWIPICPTYWEINLKAQMESDRSHVKIYKDMVALKKMNTLKYGHVNVTTFNKDVVVIFRWYEDHPTVVVVLSFSKAVETIDLTKQRASLPNSLYFYSASLNINNVLDDNNNYKLYESSNVILPPLSALVLTTQQMK